MDIAVDSYGETRATELALFKASIEETIEWLSLFGADASGGVTRLLYDASWQEAQSTLAQRMLQLGLEVTFDEVGNLHGILKGSHSHTGAIVTGSHIDTVVHGGKFDGTYGIAAGMIAIQHLWKQYGRPKRDLHIISFCEEEGSRFPLAYWGSGYITGRYSLAQVPEAHDLMGISLLEAMTAAGFGAGTNSPKLVPEGIHAFIELHIEQGAVLEQEKQAIGLVQGIVGQKRLTFEVGGIANHAGTTPMTMRSDALAGVAEMIQEVEHRAKAYGPPLVATVGSLEIKPNLTNVIAGHVTFTLDARHANSSELAVFCEALITGFDEIALKRNLALSYKEWMDAAAVMLDSGLTQQVEVICQRNKLPYRQMFSGAGHDAQLMQSICPSTMIFVPSRAGISHSSEEYTSSEELAVGILVLKDLLYELAYHEH
ncbi:MAG: Zn-dependent hydrolase [Gorillibacterium sp.]|nr:Zn-dependent hydrolase [Gorillibacterium sp.]